MRFLAEKIIKGRPYPALACHQARPFTQGWREFGRHWPYTVPAELFGHMDDHAYDYTVTTQTPGWYVIGLGFFDFNIDYFSLLSDQLIGHLRSNRIKLLFYYHEGDNPYRIKSRLDQLCDIHLLDSNCYRFVSGNTAAQHIPGFVWFPDHELLYWRRNRQHAALPVHCDARPYDFLVLSRTHKWWRATAMANLLADQLLERSLWSYNTEINLDELRTDNPIEESQLSNIDVDKFLAGGPYRCDQLSPDDHNNHETLVPEHYTQTYCSVVFETHFDADGSRGAFLSEKTFKAIKHGHPFVIVGTPHSLATLRSLGYRTFDHAIDNMYDTVEDNTLRWKLIKYAIQDIKKQNMHQWFESCRDDIEHNQKLFLESKKNRLSKLFSQLGNL